MTIPDLIVRSKEYLRRVPADVLVVLVLVLTASASFGLGVLAGRDLGPQEEGRGLWIEQLPAGVVSGAGGPAAAIRAATPPPATSGTYMASKNGTKYYLPTCGSANRIKEANRVWFATKAAAEAAGYTPAANCPGL